MKSKPQKPSRARDHEDSADERKEVRMPPAEERNQEFSSQEFATTRPVSRRATQGEKRNARATRAPEPDSEFELPI